MSETSAIEARMTAALDRIAGALGRMSGDVLPEDEASALRAALEDERLANAQLMERVKAIKERQETTVAELEGKVKRLGRALAGQEAVVAKLRKTNDALRANNAALRAANAEGVGDAELINAGMEGELDALRAARAADKAEVDDVLGELGAMIGGETSHA